MIDQIKKQPFQKMSFDKVNTFNYYEDSRIKSDMDVAICL